VTEVAALDHFARQRQMAEFGDERYLTRVPTLRSVIDSINVVFEEANKPGLSLGSGGWMWIGNTRFATNEKPLNPSSLMRHKILK
jgi:hypothetical protein